MMSAEDVAYYTSKKYLESKEYEDKKFRINREINENKLVIDYSIFKHLPGETLEISIHKSNIKENEKIK